MVSKTVELILHFQFLQVRQVAEHRRLELNFTSYLKVISYFRDKRRSYLLILQFLPVNARKKLMTLYFLRVIETIPWVFFDQSQD
jgi:hypothetical protein